MRMLSLAVLGAAAFATPAFAQDTNAPPSEKPPFEGPRVGVLIGYDALHPGSAPGSAITDRNGADGLLYGGEIGYDKALGGVIIGVEGEVSGSTAKATNDPVNGLGFGRVKAGRDLYAGARIGTLIGPRTMVYAKGGYTNGRLDLVASDGTTETGEHFNLDGYRVGAGIEHQLGRHSYAKLEYRYSNYGDARLEYANGGNTDNFSVDTDRHQIVAGVGFRF